jgi:hypothetical protein
MRGLQLVPAAVLPAVAGLLLAFLVPFGARGTPPTEADQLPPPSRFTLSNPVVRVPFDHEGRHALIRVHVNGEGPFPFLLDTGASGDGALDWSLVRALSLRRDAEVTIDDGSGLNQRRVPLVEVDALEMGGITFHGARLFVGEIRQIARHVDYPEGGPLGIVGLGLFKDLLLTIDYPESRVEVGAGALREGELHVAPYSLRDGLIYLPLRIGDLDLTACVDTGSQSGLSLPLDFSKRVRCAFTPLVTATARTANNEYEILSSVLKDPLHLAGHSMEGQDVSFNGLFDEATLGYGLLKEYRLTFDQERHLVRLDQRIAAPTEVRRRMPGLRRPARTR